MTNEEKLKAAVREWLHTLEVEINGLSKAYSETEDLTSLGCANRIFGHSISNLKYYQGLLCDLLEKHGAKIDDKKGIGRES